MIFCPSSSSNIMGKNLGRSFSQVVVCFVSYIEKVCYPLLCPLMLYVANKFVRYIEKMLNLARHVFDNDKHPKYACF